MPEAAITHDVTLLPTRGEQLIGRLVEELGEDPHRAGLVKTPRRTWLALTNLTDGYGKLPAEVIGDAIFTEEYDEMVTVRDIEFFSLCEHHLLPFFGHAHIAYVPNGKI